MTPKARDIQRAKQSAWERQAQRRRRIVVGAWIGAGLAFAALVAYLAWQQSRPIPRTGEDIPIQSADHIEFGQPHGPYSSNPPTSGPHYAQPAEPGFYEAAPPDEQLVHNLEHGYVIIWYNCSALAPEACDQLKSQVRTAMQSAGVSRYTGTPKLIAVPRPDMETLIALTSWGRLDKFDAFDGERIRNYIRAFRDRAPEPNAQ